MARPVSRSQLIAQLGGTKITSHSITITVPFNMRYFHTVPNEKDPNKPTLSFNDKEQIKQMLNSDNIDDVKLAVEIISNVNKNCYLYYIFYFLENSPWPYNKWKFIEPVSIVDEVKFIRSMTTYG